MPGSAAEVTPEFSNTEPVIAVTESGTVRVADTPQQKNAPAEILVTCDGASKQTDQSDEQPEN
jgi:hypothetical protein